MGYPTAYRTSQARQERQLSRPDRLAPPPRPANDNYRPPRPVPANDNFPGHLPPKIGAWVKNPAVKRAAQIVLGVHPILRAFMLGWKLYELYDWLASVRTYEGEGLKLQCSVPYSSLCDSGTPCGPTSYCGGPVFFNAINAALCGLGGQGYGFNAQAYPYLGGTMDGIFIQLIRPGFPFCQPAAVLRQYQTTAQYGNGKLRLGPQFVPWVETVPSPWAPFRFYKPQKFMRPGDPVQVTPLPPPYDYIPERTPEDMWPGERGYEVEQAQRVAENPWAVREPAPPRTREKKVKATGSARVLGLILGSIGRVHGKLADLRDILGAMNDALPKELQLKGRDKKRIPKLLENVWKNLDKMDGEKALAGIIKEIAEDVVGGAGDMLRAEAANKFGWLKNKVYTSPRF